MEGGTGRWRREGQRRALGWKLPRTTNEFGKEEEDSESLSGGSMRKPQGAMQWHELEKLELN
jgi:hypothetical protein